MGMLTLNPLPNPRKLEAQQRLLRTLKLALLIWASVLITFAACCFSFSVCN
jgi:hypothetical protein